MKDPARDISLLSQEHRTSAINQIIDHFATELDQEIGIIVAEAILDMFLETAGAQIYNKGVDDTKDFLKKAFEENQLDIEIQLKKSIE